jgi:choline dehydrogenase-like flavoprotein
MLSIKDLEPAFEAAERESSVAVVPEDMRSRATNKWVEGATKLGIPVKSMSRNTEGCVGYGRCNFGCPVGAKKSVDLAYLPAAVAAGARVYSDCLVEKVLTKEGRARGVRGRLLSARDARGSVRRVGQFEVLAKHVVLAAGTVHTPLLMMRSGFRSPHLGRHMTLHPGFRVVARFADRLEGWKGALQSVYVDHFEDQGVTLTGLFVPPSVLAAGLPGTGPAFAERIQNLDRLAIFGGIVHDEGGGRVHDVPGREPLLTYRLGAKEKAEMIHGTKIIAEAFLAGGAEEVYLPVFGAPAMRSMEDVGGVLHDQLSARRMECVTFHPLGTCRIGRRREEGVVDAWGRSFELPNLTVACGSVFPTSIGVNSQLPILAMSTRMAWRLRDELVPRAHV